MKLFTQIKNTINISNVEKHLTIKFYFIITINFKKQKIYSGCRKITLIYNLQITIIIYKITYRFKE